MTIGQTAEHIRTTHQRYCIIITRENSDLTKIMLHHTMDALHLHEVLQEDTTILEVPSLKEMPFTAHAASNSKHYSAVICLGASADALCSEVERMIIQACLQSPAPVVSGIVALPGKPDTHAMIEKELISRGSTAAETAIEMVNILRSIRIETIQDEYSID